MCRPALLSFSRVLFVKSLLSSFFYECFLSFFHEGFSSSFHDGFSASPFHGRVCSSRSLSAGSHLLLQFLLSIMLPFPFRWLTHRSALSTTARWSLARQRRYYSGASRNDPAGAALSLSRPVPRPARVAIPRQPTEQHSCSHRHGEQATHGAAYRVPPRNVPAR